MPAVEESWFSHVGLFIFVALIPLLVVACTSFAKVTVVLTITKNAFGSQGIVPLSVITALSLVITIFIMGPVIDEMMKVDIPTRSNSTSIPGNSVDDQRSTAQSDGGVFKRAIEMAKVFSPPIVDFLKNNTPEDEINFFTKLDKSSNAKVDSIRVLLVAFASNELIEAFVLGFLVLIPFLVIDLIVANTLGALGLVNISVLAISLPLKLLLFIAADGWHLLINALVVSYGGQ